MPANAISVLKPMDKGVILNFESYYLQNTFPKAIAATDSDFSGGSEQSKLKTFWKGFTILDAMKNIHHSWEEVKISTLTGVWKKLILTFIGDFKGFKTSVEEVNVDAEENSKRTRIRSGA